jgi:serine/threonine protein kinase
MALSQKRIHTAGQTPHEHERSAFDFVVSELPDVEPYHLWAFLDLIDPRGRRYDIDLLLIGYHAVYLIEVKSHNGTLTGDAVDWTFTFPGGGRSVMENPLHTTTHKARVLASLLEKQLGRDAQSRSPRAPWVQPLVFLSNDDLRIELRPPGNMHVVTRENLRQAITRGEFPGAPHPLGEHPINTPLMRATCRAFDALGLRPSVAARKVQDLLLGELLEDGSYYQDQLGVHQSMHDIQRRVRTYVVPASTTAERRDQLHRAARREAQHLTALSDHRGILRLFDYVDVGPMGGPCVIFEHFADALPLDAFLHANPRLTFDDRIAIIQQVAEALAFCHRKQIIHSALSPRAVLVRRRAPGPDELHAGKPDAARDAGPIEVRLYNFQLAASADISATSHPTALSSDQTALYLAPEVLESPVHADSVADIFSLGCIAYHVLTGRAPGTSLSERAQLLAGGHLSIAAARDDLAGAQTLDEVVALATQKNPLQRADSVMEWLELLLDAATAPAAEPEERHAHPLEAQRGDRLEHGLEVVKVLGTGSTARVLRVRRDDSEYALKVALDPDMDERVRREGQVLSRLQADRATSHDRIVSLVEELTLGDRACLLMSDAGESLAALISRDGPPSLDFARRWGDDLLQALEVLEEAGIQHRDIKPANLGILPSQAKKKRNLRLFDFSLSAAADTAITAGTPAYRDPFLDRRGRWDPAADRWAAAITLHELCSGTRPHWGGAPGQNELPAVATDHEITLAAERFDSAIRSRLVAFFRRALARDVAARFASAEEMRTEWVACFATASWTAASATAGADDADDALPASRPPDLGRIGLDTPIDALPLSARARNALDRAGMMTVADLLRMPQNRLSTTRGIGRATAQEILRFVEDYRAAHPEHTALTPAAPFLADYRGPGAAVAFVPGLPPEAAAALADAGLSLLPDVAAAPREQVVRILSACPGADRLLADFLRAAAAATATAEGTPATPGTSAAPATIDDWLDDLLPDRGKRPPYITQMRMLLGLDPVPGATAITVGMYGHAADPLGRASEITTLARHLGKTRAAIHLSLTKARKRWQEHPYLADLHTAVCAALDSLGGVAPVVRVSEVLRRAIPPRLATSGTSDTDAAAQAERRALALVRIAAETSGEMTQARVHSRLWLARTPLHVSLARALGERADALAGREPLPSSEEVRESLARVVENTPLAALPPERLVAMAADASSQAAPSARLELYPRGLPAARAIALSAGALPPGPVSIDTLRRVVQARYPEAAPIPDRDQLDDLMLAVGLRWNPTERAYVRPDLAHATSVDTHVISRRDTTHTSHRPAPSPASDEAREFEARLRLAITRGHFRVLDVTAGLDNQAADELAHRTGARPVSLEREILAEAFRLVRELDIDPAVVLAADRDGPAAPDDWANLRTLMKQAATAVIDRVYQAGEPVILTQPGLLARYSLDDVAEHMVALSRRDHAPAVLLLNPTDDAAAPATIDATPRPLAVPLSSPAQRMRVPESWLRNLHRGAPL